MHSEGQTSAISHPPLADISTQTRRVFLVQEHRDLDDMIALLAESADESLLTRLKKRKLHLKDEMMRLEAVAVS